MPRSVRAARRLARGAASGLVAALLAMTMGVGPVAAAYQATIDANTTAFNKPCTSIVNSYPAKMRDAAVSAYASLGYAASSFSGTAFTESHVLSRTLADTGYYVHSHGDLYAYNGRADSGFRADGGACSGAIVNAAEILQKRAGRLSNLIFMSTCHLGEPAANMPGAFGIARSKYTTTWGGPKFYVGYYGAAWDSDEWIFEQAFWSALRSGRSAGAAFDIASAKSFGHPFAANWWGSYTYYALPGPYNGCRTCV